MARIAQRGLLALALSLLVGCPSASMLGSAWTLDKGHWEAGGTAGVGLQLQNGN